MIELRVLGALELKGPAGEDILSVLSQPKRIALLAYLALSTTEGFQRRDKIVGLFWPELDQERARGSLRKGIYFLRRSLGEEVLVSRGDEELAINQSVLSCDAVDFDRALERGDLEAALDLYRGDLLEGLFVAESPGFEAWMEDQRERLREAAAGAAWTLAHSYLDQGRVTEGERLGQRALTLFPTEELQVVRFIEALAGAGERAGAVHFYEKFARVLDKTLDLEPAPETQALVQDLRNTMAEDPPPPPVMVPADRSSRMVDFAPASDELPDAAGGRSRPGIPRGWLLAGLATAAVTVAGFLLPRVLQDRSRTLGLTTSNGIIVAIMPFSVQGPDSMQWLSESMVTLLGTSMDDVGGVRTVDRNLLLGSVGRLQPGGRLSLEQAREAALRLGATHFILGEGLGTGGGRLTLASTVYPVNGRSGDEIEVRVDGSLSDPYGLVDNMIRPILGGLQVAVGERLAGLAALTTDSTRALRAFLKGEEHFRSTRYAEASEAFDQAVRIDETFALAHYRRSVAAVLDLRFDEAHLAADRAWTYSARLSKRDRRLLQAWGALIEGSADRAERLYQGILEDYPDEVEALFGLGSDLVYFNPSRGRPIQEAEPYFRRVIELMPSFGQARFHLLEFATIRRDRRAFDSLFSGVDPESDQALAWEAVRAFAWGSSESQARVEARIRTAAPVEAGLAVARVAAYLQTYAEAENLAGLLTGSDRDPDTRCAALILTSLLRFARGRWTDGMDSLHGVAQCNQAWATELQALFTGFPLRSPAPEELDVLQDRLLGWEADQAASSADFVLFAHNGFHPSLRRYLLALTDVWEGDVEGALRDAAELSRAGRTQEMRAINQAWAGSVRARIAAVQGDTVEAVHLLEGARADVSLELVAISPFFSRSFDRFLLGQFLMSLGREQEALEWFRTLTEGHELVLVAPAHLYMARILESQGNLSGAEAHYDRFQELWHDADPLFHPLLLDARSRTDPPPVPRNFPAQQERQSHG